MMIALLCYLLGLSVDWMWAEYIGGVARKEPLRAAVFSALIVLAGAASVRLYVLDFYNALPTAMGALTGTFVSVYRRRKS